MKFSTPTLIKISSLLFLVTLFTVTVHAQTGPAGVGNSTNNQYWLDAHAMDFPDGVTVTSWNDLSGNEGNFEQAVSTRRPTYVASGIGGLPALSYDGVDDVLTTGPNSNMETNSVTYFMVYDRVGTSTSMIINADYDSDFRKWRSYSNIGQNKMVSVQFSPTIKFVFYDDLGPGSFFSTHIEPTRMQTYYQGNMEAQITDTYTTPTGHNGIYLGNRSAEITPTYNYTGLISEVIIYNGTVNSLERILIENYLGNKYGMSIPTDLYDYEATHKFGLIGLANDGTNTQTVAQGAGIVELSGATDLGTGEHFITAHTDVSISDRDGTDLPAGLPAHERLSRTWRVDESGDVGTTTITFQLGEEDYGVPSTYRLLVDNDGIFTDAVTVAGTYDAGTQSVSFTTNLSDGDFFTLTGIPDVLEIHSITTGLWSSTATWDCTCIPEANDLVHIDPSHTVTVDIDAFTDFLRIESTATLSMSSDVTLDINGDWEILGTTNLSNGTVSLTGDVAQTISAIPAGSLNVGLHDLLINNTGVDNITFGGGIFSLMGTFSPNRGSIVIDPSATFRIASTDATTGGRVGPIISPTTLTGDFEVQRNIPAGAAGWRNLCSPVIGSTFDNWDPDLAMSGPSFPDGCAFGPDGCFYSVTFTENSILGEVPYSAFPILNARGYEIYVGTDTVTFDGTTLHSTGPLNTSNDITKSFTGGGWQTIGNPYASPIAFSTVSRSGSVGNYYYVLNGETGSYEWYDGSSGTSSIPSISEDGVIAIGQGIWVFASSAGSLTFNQFNKTDANATFLSPSEVETSLKIKLSENSSNYECVIHLEEAEGAIDGTNEFEDIRHLSTGLEAAPSIAIQVGEELLRKNFIKNDGIDKTFDIHTKLLNDGYYTISMENLENFRNYHKVLLLDRHTGEIVNLKQTDYIFFGSEFDAEIKKGNRFRLILSNNAEVNSGENISETEILANELFTIKQIGNIVEVQNISDEEVLTTVTLTTILGQSQVFNLTTSLISGSNMITLPSELKGFYIITLKTGDEQLSRKIML